MHKLVCNGVIDGSNVRARPAPTRLAPAAQHPVWLPDQTGESAILVDAITARGIFGIERLFC